MNVFHRELIRQLGVDHEVHVVSSPGHHLESLSADLGLMPHIIPMTREISPRRDLRAFTTWVRLLAQLRPNLVVSATPKASLLAQIAASVTGVPRRLYYVGGLRFEGDVGVRRAVLVLLEKVTGRAATHVVVNSDSALRAATEMRLYRASKLSATDPGSSHGVDSTHFKPGARDPVLLNTLALDTSLPIIGFAGRLTHDKGVDDLIAALEMLVASRVSVQLLVLGSQDEPDSATYVERLRASGARVSLAGEVSDMRRYYRLMDVHVLPSLREGFPNVVLESAACGVPTVTTTATGCVDSVVDGETGLLVPPRDSTALADAICALLDNEDRRLEMGRAGRRRAVKDFQPESVVRSLLAPVSAPKALRVLHVINGLGRGGAERLVVDLCAQLRADGVDARIAALSPSDDEPLAQEAAIRGVPLITVGSSRFDPRSMARLRPWTRNADVVHAHLFPAVWVAAATPSRHRVTTEHSPTNNRRHSALASAVDRLVYRRFDSIVAISDGVADAVRAFAPRSSDRVERIWNGVRLDRLSPRTASAHRPLRLVCVGTLDPRKDVGSAIRAVQDVQGVHLTIVGSGPDRERLELMAGALAPGRVTFTGHVDDVAAVLPEMDVFLTTSRYEGFGLAAVEAMGSGLPVLAPAVPGLREVVGPAGLLHSSDDLDALRAHMALLRDHEDIRRDLARRSVLRADSFSVGATARAHAALYHRLMGTRSR
jgi:glycosyltransferase involved in cell wall biosynthesis